MTLFRIIVLIYFYLLSFIISLHTKMHKYVFIITGTDDVILVGMMIVCRGGSNGSGAV